MCRRLWARAAVAKLGNGARFRVSSRRGSQVRILAAAFVIEPERALVPRLVTDSGDPTRGEPLARLVRPFWILCWASFVFAGFGLVPTLLPVYGARLPTAWWLGVVVQFSGTLILATVAWWRRSSSAILWLAMMGAGLGVEIIYTAGAVALLTMVFDFTVYVIIASFGIVSLGVLVQLERWGIHAMRSPGPEAKKPTP